MSPYADIYGLEQFSKQTWTASQNIGKSGTLKEFVPLLKMWIFAKLWGYRGGVIDILRLIIIIIIFNTYIALFL